MTSNYYFVVENLCLDKMVNLPLNGGLEIVATKVN